MPGRADRNPSFLPTEECLAELILLIQPGFFASFFPSQIRLCASSALEYLAVIVWTEKTSYPVRDSQLVCELRVIFY